MPAETPPFAALFWMLTEAFDSSSERVEGLTPGDAVRELDDIDSVMAWLGRAGMPAELLEKLDGERVRADVADSIRASAQPPVPVCAWFAEEGKRGPGWYWDTAEDSGGFDRVSPMGPHEDKAEAQAAAEKIFGRCTWFDGFPDHYEMADAA